MVVIIGATGFIGMYTTEAFLKKGEDVVATGRNKLLGKKLEEMGAKFVELDITQKEDFSKLPTEDVSGVILLADAYQSFFQPRIRIFRFLSHFQPSA